MKAVPRIRVRRPLALLLSTPILGASLLIGPAAYAVTWDIRVERNGANAAECHLSYTYAGYLNFVRWEDGYPYTICMINADANLQYDVDLRSLDFFLDDYYVGMNSSTSLVNTRYMVNGHTVNFIVYNATSCTGSNHTVYSGDDWHTYGFKVTSVKRSGSSGC